MALVPSSTPISQGARLPDVSTPSPGTWRHPKFDEVAQRQKAALFTDGNLRKIIWNGGALLALWIANELIKSYPEIPNAFIPQLMQQYTHTFLIFLRLLSIFNIAMSFSPFFMKKDDFTDIPLTPSQRALMGLDPNVTSPVTLTAQYITPPRYPRSSTPRTGSPGSQGTSSGTKSLTSRKGSPLLGPQGGESPFSPSPSPLWQKAVGGSRDALRKSSYSSPSPLGHGIDGKEASIFGLPSTPSPTIGKAAGVGLSNKWLYERGRVSPGSRLPRIFS